MRSPRKSFSAPFVITTLVGAAGSAGFTSCNPPAAQRPAPDPLIGKNPPAPDPDPQPDPAAGGRKWSVYKQGADCFAIAAMDCPKPANPGGPVPTCNPPPAAKYACPEHVSLDHPIEVEQWGDAADASCYVVTDTAMSCPAGASCNPPPPMKVACPTP